MCASLAADGNHGMSNVAVCVDLSWFPSGRLIRRGLVAVFMSRIGVPGSKKWLVAPASAMAISMPILMAEVL